MTTNESGPAEPNIVTEGEPAPENIWLRLVYMILFAAGAWFVFGLTIFLGLLQFVVIAVNKAPNDELKSLSASTIMYLSDIMAYICFLKNDKPFPFGSLPKKSR